MKRLILASLAMVALASCSKESTMDVAIKSSQTPITFTTYAGSSADTKGNPVDSNSEFEVSGSQFDVSAYFTSTATGEESNTGKYFGFNTVKYTSGDWTNQTDMYWPNEAGTLTLGAYYPSDADGITPSYSYTSPNHLFGLTYTIEDLVTDQIDLMYAIKEEAITVTSGSASDVIVGSENAINLHFKHALTQIAFTATKDSDITVEVSDIRICNVKDTGSFAATETTDDDYSGSTTPYDDVDTDNFGTWTTSDSAAFKNYVAAMKSTTVSVGGFTNSTALTKTNDALMLLPQELTAWDTTGTTSNDTGSYLAINCVIKHANDGEASIIDGYVFVPFNTNDIKYSDTLTEDEWLPGYKITYNLHFGGGYTVPSDPTDVPEPGDVPEPDDIVTTLREISYTISVDEWIPIDDSVSM